MPNLPGLGIADQAMFERVFSAFNNSPTEFKTWIREALKDEVLRREARLVQQQADVDIESRRNQLNTGLDKAQ